MSEIMEKNNENPARGKKKKLLAIIILARNIAEGLKKGFQTKKQIMEIGGSVLYLNPEDEKNKINDQKNVQFSNSSLPDYCETPSVKKYFPQTLAAVLSAMMHLSIGMTMTFSAVLIAQLQSKDSDLKATTNEITWIASVLMLTMPIGNLSGGFIMERLGRLNTLKLTVIPLCLGWILLATANNVTMVIVGRMLSGVAGAWGTNPALVFITEISCPTLRGSLVSLGASFATLGMAMSYILGWILPWRLFAWLANIIPVATALTLLTIPESPAWLVQRGKIGRAKKSLEWYYKYYPQSSENGQNIVENQLEHLVKTKNDRKQEHAEKNRGGFKIFIHEFIKPTGYKPFLIMLGLLTVQQFSGIFVVLMYAVTFNEAVGARLDPYLTSTISGFFRFFVTAALVVLLKKFPRRGLLITSSLCMAFFMGISGLFTSLIKQGNTTFTWVPVICNFLYFGAAGFGLSSIPWSMTAEVYPLEIRGIAHSFTMTCGHLAMFTVIKSYYVLNQFFGGVVGMQYFFAIISVWAAVYVYIFLPETKDKKLLEIEEYFKRHTVYLGENIINSEARKSALKMAEEKQKQKFIEKA